MDRRMLGDVLLQLLDLRHRASEGTGRPSAATINEIVDCLIMNRLDVVELLEELVFVRWVERVSVDRHGVTVNAYRITREGRLVVANTRVARRTTRDNR